VGGEGYFDDPEEIAEPDFVDPDDDGALDEEVSRLSKQKGFGFGGIIDRMVGFSLFNVDEDREQTADEDNEVSKQEAVKRRQADLKKKSDKKLGRCNAAEQVQPAGRGEEGGWNDAAWLLSVASKVLY
jgi:hypothetical protein